MRLQSTQHSWPRFLQKVYENALKIELQNIGIHVRQQPKIPVFCESRQVGLYFPDLWVEEQLIVEIKACNALAQEHEQKVVHYLTATGIEHGLLINFGTKVQIKHKFREYRPRNL